MSGAPVDLSVLMPTHRGERWLGMTLDSLAAEADERVEVVLVDSSPDEQTLGVARAYADRLKMTLIATPELRSWTAQTNLAAAHATGSHLAMLHQDDLWQHGRLAAIRRWVAIDPEALLHLAPSVMVDAAGRAVGQVRCPLPDDRNCSAELAERLLVQNFVMIPAPVIRRDAWDRVDGLDEALWYTADWDLWLKLAHAGPTRYHPEPTTAFRVHGGSLTVTGSRDLGDFRRQMEMVLSRHAPAGKLPVGRAARASIGVNTALAGAAGGGGTGPLVAALGELLLLGPTGLARYLRYSRLVERVMPRVRARLAGSF